MTPQHHTHATSFKPESQHDRTRSDRPGAPRPTFEPVTVAVEHATRARATDCAGLSLFHALVHGSGLPAAIDEQLSLLNAHLPYFESDHVLALVYSMLAGGTCLQDLDALRADAAVMTLLGAERVPAPTTAGDFLRRFTAEAILALQQAINRVRARVWAAQHACLRREAILDADGTLVETGSQCAEGVSVSYKGLWGYAPLLLTLAATGELLYVVNRPGGATSALGAEVWIDRALALLRPHFARVWLRGDTDFSMTAHLDRWDAEGVRFVLGYDACPALVARAEALADRAWYGWDRRPARRPDAVTRRRPEAVKAAIVEARGYRRIRLLDEQVAEFDYQPVACRRAYRMVAVRKQLEISRGGQVVEHETRYRFYITNDRVKAPHTVVRFANARCNQENVIAQLKGGLAALRCPTKQLEANWAWMVIGGLAWSLKAWLGQMIGLPVLARQLLQMEFKRVLREVIRVPARVVRRGRRVRLRIESERAALVERMASLSERMRRAWG